MDTKVAASIVSSFAIACLVYFFNESLFSGLEPILFAAYVVVILIITTIDVFMIIRQKMQIRKIIMIVFLVLSLLSSMIISRIYIPTKNINGTPGRHEETL